MKIITSHPLIGNDKFISKNDSKFIYSLQADDELDTLIHLGREELNIPIDGLNLDKPITDWATSKNINLAQIKAESIMRFRYKLPERWMPTFFGILTANLGRYPIPAISIIKDQEFNTSLRFIEIVNSSDIKEFLAFKKNRDELDSKTYSLPERNKIHGSIDDVERRVRIIKQKRDGISNSKIAKNEKMKSGPSAAQTTYRKMLDQLERDVLKGFSIVPGPMPIK